MLNHVLKVIQENDSFVISSHRSPDGDSVGSQLALAEILESLGKRTLILNQDPVPIQLQNLPGASRIQLGTTVPEDGSVVVVMECSTYRLTGLNKVEGRCILNIDHHPTNTRFGTVDWIDEEAPSVGDMVFRLARELDVKITPTVANQIYISVLTDTGSFRYSNTTARAFRLCAELVDLGASPHEVANGIYGNQSPGKIRLMGEVISTLQLDESGDIAWIKLSKEGFKRSGAVPEETEGLIDIPRSIRGVRVTVFCKEVDSDFYRVSFRSNGDIDVSSVAGSFGGGGHHNAAGCGIPGDYEQVVEKVTKEIRSRFEAL